MVEYISENSMVNTCMKGLFNVIDQVNCSSKEFDGIYHYTSTEVLDSLLTEATFWASNLYYLNDSSEYQTGIFFLKKIFAEKIKDNPEMDEQRRFCIKCIEEIQELDGYSWPGIFSISFSIEEDILNQWLTYAKEGGVCIKFEKEIMLGKGQKDDSLIIEEVHDGKGILAVHPGNIAKMIYDNNIDKINAVDIIEIIREMLEGLYNIESNEINEFVKYKKNIKFFFALLASYVKNGNFVIEDEIRMLCPFMETLEKKTAAKIFYNRRTNGILRPYIKVRFRQGEELLSASPKLPIQKIIVGPAGNQDAVFNSIVHRVEHGNPAVWKYGIQYLEKFLVDYVQEYLKRVKEGNKTEAEQSVNYILYEWCRRSGYTYMFSIKVNNNRFIPTIHIGDITDVENKSIEKEKDSELSGSLEKDIVSWKKDNFLSKQGVWIKKSKIPFAY